MKQKLTNPIYFVTALLLAFLVYNAIAGSIEPTSPPGVSSMRTLDEIYAAVSNTPSDDPMPNELDVMGAKAIHMKVTGSEQGEFKGSCTAPGREDLIGVIGIQHKIEIPTDANTGLPTGQRIHLPMTVTKRIDKSTPMLYSACCTGEQMEVELTFYRKSEKGQIEHYYTVKLSNARIVAMSQIDTERETIEFTYEKIIWTYEIDGIEAEDDWMSHQV